MYDGRVGRWMTTDPYSEFHSPYLAMGNSPVGTIDPDGGCTCPVENDPFPLSSDQLSELYGGGFTNIFLPVLDKYMSDLYWDDLNPAEIAESVFDNFEGYGFSDLYTEQLDQSLENYKYDGRELYLTEIDMKVKPNNSSVFSNYGTGEYQFRS
jgi:hypothetical protein